MYFNQYLLLQLVHNVFKSLKLCEVSLKLNFEFFKISTYAFIRLVLDSTMRQFGVGLIDVDKPMKRWFWRPIAER
jgi:cell division ATPase FtsA